MHRRTRGFCTLVSLRLRASVSGFICRFTSVWQAFLCLVIFTVCVMSAAFSCFCDPRLFVSVLSCCTFLRLSHASANPHVFCRPWWDLSLLGDSFRLHGFSSSALSHNVQTRRPCCCGFPFASDSSVLFPHVNCCDIPRDSVLCRSCFLVFICLLPANLRMLGITHQ